MKKTVLMMLLGFAWTGFAAIEMAPVLTSYAVLQQNEPVRIWGTADPQAELTVEFAGQIKTTVSGADGNWMVTLDPMKASFDPQTLTVSCPATREQVKLVQVLVGEVWFAGGQSNMQTTMKYYKKTSQPDIDSASDPYLRMVTVPARHYPGHNDGRRAQWKDSTPGTVSEFSASAYYFAKNLRAWTNVPVGIISCSVGGTPAEAWISRETLENNPELKPTLDAYEAAYQNAFSNEAAYLAYTEEFIKESSQWYRDRNAGETVGPRPKPKMGPQHPKRPSGLYENMFQQAVPYTVRGVIWYQGEENASAQAGYVYRTVFSELIRNWREQLRNDQLPFLFVQLATVGNGDDQTWYWPELRESQKWVDEHIENTGMAVLVDGGEVKSVHPHSKDKVGRRLALLARNLVYGESDLVCYGPRFKDMKIDGSSAVLSFTDIGGGLVLKPAEAGAFEICGKDEAFVVATAVLDGDKIKVFSEEITEPVNVRYGWEKGFTPTLFNEEGLPASPFRTDSYPEMSKGHYYLEQND